MCVRWRKGIHWYDWSKKETKMEGTAIHTRTSGVIKSTHTSDCFVGTRQSSSATCVIHHETKKKKTNSNERTLMAVRGEEEKHGAPHDDVARRNHMPRRRKTNWTVGAWERRTFPPIVHTHTRTKRWKRKKYIYIYEKRKDDVPQGELVKHLLFFGTFNVCFLLFDGFVDMRRVRPLLKLGQWAFALNMG